MGNESHAEDLFSSIRFHHWNCGRARGSLVGATTSNRAAQSQTYPGDSQRRERSAGRDRDSTSRMSEINRFIILANIQRSPARPLPHNKIYSKGESLPH